MSKSDRVKLVFFVFLFSAACLWTVDVNAQTKRPKTTKPAVVASPTPPAGDFEVVSRAEDQKPTLVFVEPPTNNPAEPATDNSSAKIKELSARIKKLETTRTDAYDEKQKRLLLNLDILTRAEQRADGLRKQLFDMMEKVNSIKSRIDQLDADSRPELLNRAATYSGSMKPEEIREMRKKSLDSEKQNLQSLLAEVQSSRTNLTTTVQRADAMVDKLRFKIEKEIDDALTDPQNN